MAGALNAYSAVKKRTGGGYVELRKRRAARAQCPSVGVSSLGLLQFERMQHSRCEYTPVANLALQPLCSVLSSTTQHTLSIRMASSLHRGRDDGSKLASWGGSGGERTLGLHMRALDRFAESSTLQQRVAVFFRLPPLL